MREVAEAQTEGKCRGREERRAMGGTRGGLGELRIGNRLRHHGVHGTGKSLIMQAGHDHGGQVVDLDARHPLPARSEPATQTKSEDRTDQPHRSAIPTEDESDAEPYNPDSHCLRLDRLRFPGLSHLGEEAGSGRGVLVDGAIPRVTVEPDGRGAHEDTRLYRGGGYPFDQTAGSLDSALQNAAALLPSP